jgi:hypothetical protein
MKIKTLKVFLICLFVLSCTHNSRKIPLLKRNIASSSNFGSKEYHIESPSLESPLSNAIVKAVLGGREADQKLSSMNVYLETERGSCSGTIIAEDTILTAAHCIYSTSKEIKIFFNNDFTNSLTSTKFSKFISFPESLEVDQVTDERYLGQHLDFDFDSYQRFKEYFDNLTETSFRPLDQRHYLSSQDLALVFLDQKIPSGTQIAAMYSGPLVFRQKLIGVGYGVTSRNFQEKSNFNLRYSEMEYFAGYYYDEKLLSIRVHSGHYSKNTCAGDSGGGLWYKDLDGQYSLLGVLSAGTNNCANSKIYTLQSSYYEWIDREITKFRSQTPL